MTLLTTRTLFGLTLGVALLATPPAGVDAQESTTARTSARDLGLIATTSCAAAGGLPAHREATDLVVVGPDVAARPQFLRPDAAAAWREMRRAAKADGVTLFLISGFRSVDQQRQIIARKLRAGQTLADILAVNVPPGFSEHHSGTAVDIGTPGNVALVEDFEQTSAFTWLDASAESFGFSLSYPRGNPAGLAYEPWHWRFGPGRERRLSH